MILTSVDDFKPITNRTVCYIVCGLIFNEHGEILMMQEAKSSCYGMWYLPAGRMERNESIQVRLFRLIIFQF
jgi:8-oxo-dGDP phosphatase